MLNPFISVVIPCYNQGIYIRDALESLRKCPSELYEVIIINDGSTDDYTNNYLKELFQKGYQVVFQKNAGLAAARNTGIKLSKGKYVLPLDADNSIEPGYLIKGIEILENNNDIAVVHSNANFFGEKKGLMKSEPFNLQKLMLGNYIDACAVIRKSALENVGYYDTMPYMGFEDWDLWLRMGFNNYRFHYINEPLFNYRVVPGSMMNSLNNDIKKRNAIEDYLINKYADKLDFDFAFDLFIYKFKKNPIKFIVKTMLKKFFPKYYYKLVKENKIYKRFII